MGERCIDAFAGLLERIGEGRSCCVQVAACLANARTDEERTDEDRDVPARRCERDASVQDALGASEQLGRARRAHAKTEARERFGLSEPCARGLVMEA
jgi:hypothetical protein